MSAQEQQYRYFRNQLGDLWKVPANGSWGFIKKQWQPAHMSLDVIEKHPGLCIETDEHGEPLGVATTEDDSAVELLEALKSISGVVGAESGDPYRAITRIQVIADAAIARAEGRGE